MDIRKLKYFLVIAEERNISRAADRLHISQPPLTRQIHALEEELGVQMFSRSHHGVDLTEAGRALLNHALSITTQVEQAKQQIRRVSSGQEGRVHVVVFGSAILSTIPKVLRNYSSSYPNVKVVIRFAPRSAQIDALHRERILIAFDRNLMETPDLRSELVSRETLWVALHRDNALAAKSAVSIDDLRASPLIGETDPCVYPACRVLFERHDFEPLFGPKAADMISAVALVAGGFGTAIVPESLLNLQLPNVVYRPLDTDAECFIDLYCAYRKPATSPLLGPLLEAIRAHRRRNEQVLRSGPRQR
jgi:LysR family transcriptional regulator, benzoate and cis,cis-muconate-responsive activator of ben and cat genes